MALGQTEQYTDSEGVKHTIQEHGNNEVTYHLGGSSMSFMPTDVYIDGKVWPDYHDIGMGDPIKQAKDWIEEQIKNRLHA